MRRAEKTMTGLGFRGISALLVALDLGCASTPESGSSDFSWVEGSLVAVEQADLGRVHTAAVNALRDLGFRPHERDRDALSSLIVGEVAVGAISQQRELRVRLERMADEKTKISMRILFTRSPEKLELILDRIREELADKAKPNTPEADEPKPEKANAAAPADT